MYFIDFLYVFTIQLMGVLGKYLFLAGLKSGLSFFAEVRYRQVCRRQILFAVFVRTENDDGDRRHVREHVDEVLRDPDAHALETETEYRQRTEEIRPDKSLCRVP